MDAIIKVESLVKQYDHTMEPAVKGISFEVKEGDFFAFLGPNGAGKTTTISILTTTLNLTSGFVSIAGFNVDREAKKVREKIGLIFQQPSLDPQLSAEENIRFHACLYGMYGYRPTFKMMPISYRNQVLDLAEIVGLQEALFKPIRKLSGGMQRKLEIIRSLIHTPKILFLDEPTQGLDAVSRRSLWDYIDHVRKENGTTVFLTTHYIDEAEHVDKVCIINHGQIIISGSPQDMKNSLLRKELIIDAENPEELCLELTQKGWQHSVEDHIIVPYQGMSIQEIIGGLTTKLSLLRIHEPTLEDAYISYLQNEGGSI